MFRSSDKFSQHYMNEIHVHRRYNLIRVAQRLESSSGFWKLTGGEMIGC